MEIVINGLMMFYKPVFVVIDVKTGGVTGLVPVVTKIKIKLELCHSK